MKDLINLFATLAKVLWKEKWCMIPLTIIAALTLIIVLTTIGGNYTKKNPSWKTRFENQR